MKGMNTQNTKKKTSKQNKGFYVALAVCIVAIGAAAWTTYGSVIEYSESQNQQVSELMEESDVETGQEVSDVPYEDSSEESMEESEEDSAEDSEEAKESSTEVEESSEAEVSAQQTAQTEITIVDPIKDGEIIKEYSPEDLVESKTMGDWRTHDGIDIAADDGTEVRAMTDGIVTEITNDEMYGTILRIEHSDGYTALYCGLSPTVTVEVGDEVEAGDTIGYVYTIPCEQEDGTHLHLTMYKDGELINPEDFLSQ